MSKKKVLFDSGEEGAMMTACVQLALVLIVVVRWSMDLDVFFSNVRCTTMKMSRLEVSRKKNHSSMPTALINC